MIKNFIKGLSVIFFIFLITEILFFFYFKFNNIDEKMNNYKIKKISDESYKFFSDLGLVLPLPNKKIIHVTKDYVDIFETKDVLNQGFGLFDDGINKNRKVFSVALGDSFTRGLGSINKLENGWVELTEQNLDWLDIINLGNLGGGIPLQKYGYDKIKHLIKHDLVIYNFYTRRGFHENLIDISPDKYIETIKREKNLNAEQIQEIINKLNRSSAYKPHLEYLSNKTFLKSYTFAFILKFILLIVFLAKLILFIKEFIVLKVYSDLFCSKILFLFCVTRLTLVQVFMIISSDKTFLVILTSPRGSVIDL